MRGRYQQRDLEKCAYPHELPRREAITLNIDCRQIGVGGDNSWGLPVHDKYMIPSDDACEYAFYMQPIIKSTKDLRDTSKYEAVGFRLLTIDRCVANKPCLSGGVCRRQKRSRRLIGGVAMHRWLASLRIWNAGAVKCCLRWRWSIGTFGIVPMKTTAIRLGIVILFSALVAVGIAREAPNSVVIIVADDVGDWGRRVLWVGHDRHAQYRPTRG